MDYQIALLVEPCSRSRFFSDWCSGSVGCMAVHAVKEIIVKKTFFRFHNLDENKYKKKSNFLGRYLSEC